MNYSFPVSHSACPEKIREFEDRRAAKKKNNRKSRPKKSEKNTSVAEIDLKLQHLLLNIELGSKSRHIASREVISDKTTIATEDNFINQDPLVNLDSECNADSKAAMLCLQTGATAPKHEVIDLLSPSPQVHIRNVSRFTLMNSQHISVIDLSDSETERSPEHARKAKDLRQFLASIRDDIN